MSKAVPVPPAPRVPITCTCPWCGTADYNINQLFNLREELLAAVPRSSFPYEDFRRLVDLCPQSAMFPIYDLKRWLQNRQHPTPGTNTGRLVLPVDDWLARTELLVRDAKEETAKLFASLKDQLRKPGMPQALIDRTATYYTEQPDGNLPFNAIKIDGMEGGRNEDRFCCRCGKPLSYWTGMYPEILLTVIGGPRMSKSTSLAACASFFLSNTNYDIRWRQSTRDKGWTQFEQLALTPYHSGVRVKATDAGADEDIPRFSVLVEIGNPKNPRQCTRRVLSIVDIPGEYVFGSENGGRPAPEIFRKYEPIYRNTDCVWFITDGSELRQFCVSDAVGDGARDRLAPFGFDTNAKPTSTANLVDGLNEIRALFPANTPAVFLFGKSDAFLSDGAAAGNSDLFYCSGYDENFREQHLYSLQTLQGGRIPVLRIGDNWFNRASDLRAALEGVNADLVNGFCQAFPVHTFLATSNYGCTPDRDRGCAKRPFQTELPFLWLLAVKGLLPVVDFRPDIRERNYVLAAQPEDSAPDYPVDERSWRNLCRNDQIENRPTARRRGLFGHR